MTQFLKQKALQKLCGCSDVNGLAMNLYLIVLCSLQMLASLYSKQGF